MRMEAPAAHPQRRLAEHLVVRFPRLYDFIARPVWRMPRRSRLRQAFLKRVVRIAWEAFNRGDLDVVFFPYHERCESTFPPQFATVGMETPHGGREARMRFQKSLVDVFGELEFEPEELIESPGGHLLSLGRMRFTGKGSGASADMEWCVLLTVVDGRVMEERIYVDRREAFEAAGLSEE